MKKKLSVVFLSLIAIFSLTFTACNDPSEPNDPIEHRHSFSSVWSYNESEHFHKCDGCEETEDNAAHTYKDGICTVCGYKDPEEEKPEHKHNFSSDWSYNADEHFHKCEGCEERKDNAAHTYKDGVCTECGYEEPEEEKPEHKHNFSSEWSFNADEHFHKCEGCEERKDNAAHIYEDDKCTICGYVRKPSEGLSYELNEDRNSYSVTGTGECKDKNIIIPDTYMDLPVTSIGDRAFNGYRNLQSILIPSGVTSIGDSAFMGCVNLESIEIPSGVTSIGGGAFGGCTNLSYYEDENARYLGGSQNEHLVLVGVKDISAATFTIPKETKIIYDEAFSGCSALQSMDLSGVTCIGNKAFRDCIGLKAVVIGADVVRIGDNAFDLCYKLIEVRNNSSLNIEVGSKENGSAGYYAKNIYSDDNGGSKIKEYQGYSFYTDEENKSYLLGYNGSETNITLPDNFNGGDYVFYDYAFAWRSDLQSIEIPSGITDIGYHAFYRCSSLQSVIIGDGVTSIGNSTFYGCSDLRKIKIGAGVTSIDFQAFAECASLRIVDIGENVTKIGGKAFSGCVNLLSVKLPLSLTSIGFEAFGGCYRLIEICNNSHIYIRAGSEENGSIGYYARNIYNDRNGVTKIIEEEGYSFYIDKNKNERYLLSYYGTETDLVLPKYITSNAYDIYDYAFRDRTDLQSIVMDGAIKYIRTEAFSGCTNLQSVRLPNGLISIGDGAFSGCASLQGIELNEMLTGIGANAFSGCGLKSINIPVRVAKIGSGAFRGCAALQSVTIPDFALSIGDSAFEDCTSLCSVVIGEYTNSLGKYLFENCTALQMIYYHGTPQEWKQIKKDGYNNVLLETPISYYSASDPRNGDNYNPSLSYWHYENEEIVVWD